MIRRRISVRAVRDRLDRPMGRSRREWRGRWPSTVSEGRPVETIDGQRPRHPRRDRSMGRSSRSRPARTLIRHLLIDQGTFGCFFYGQAKERCPTGTGNKKAPGGRFGGHGAGSRVANSVRGRTPAICWRRLVPVAAGVRCHRRQANCFQTQAFPQRSSAYRATYRW